MNDEFGTTVVVVILVLLSLSVGIGFGYADAVQRVRAEAIEHNAAEWRIDPKTGESEFVWLGQESK